MKDIRLGIIGCGFRGPDLLAVSRKVEGLTPVAVCATSEATGVKVKANAPDVEFYTDYTAMLDSGSVDAVVVETPPALHAACSIAALARNVDMLRGRLPAQALTGDEHGRTP